MKNTRHTLEHNSILSYLKKSAGRFYAKEKKLSKLSNRYSYYRLLIFLSGLTVSLTLFFLTTNLISLLSFTGFSLFFGIAANIHNKIDKSIKRHNEWIRIKKKDIARINLDWQNIPRTSFTEKIDAKPVEYDLNLTGNQSLHHLIDNSVTVKGSLLLREWLINKAPSGEEILRRQRIVKELIPLYRFRNKLLLISNLTSKKNLNGDELLQWLKNSVSQKNIKGLLIILSIIAPINIVLFLLNLWNIIPAYWSFSLIVYIGIYYFGMRNKDKLSEEAEYLKTELGRMSLVLSYLDEYNCGKNIYLNELLKTYHKGKYKPSLLLRRIKRIANVMLLRKGNPFIWTIMRAFFPVDYFFAYRMSLYKEAIELYLPNWLQTFYELEALSSLANFAFLNPEYSFPEIIPTDTQEEIVFNAENIGHPLIPAGQKVCNDFSFSQLGEINIITGSNMSGKSTFLRTLGLNLSLAYAGGVVNASKFRTSIYRIFTCIKISDSVTDGISYFYAEVKRLKALLDEIKKDNSEPVFYLIDEIFRGTNNIERLTGSRSYIKSLSKKNGIGIISTHDLELVNLADDIININNYHFKEEIAGGKMLFDYKIHSGPCPTTNALKIMSMEGLPVDESDYRF